MSFNIRLDTPSDGANAWPHRDEWVAEIIRSHGDLVGLQEVLPNQLADLRQQLPSMEYYGVGRNDGKASGESVPLFYRKDRFERLDQSTFWLSEMPDKPGSVGWDAAITRIASWVKLRDRETDEVLYFVNTHFDHRGRTARVESAALLVAQIQSKFPDHPVILTGDFNTTPDSRPYATLVGQEAGQAEVTKRFLHDALHRSTQDPEGPDSTWSGFRAVQPNRRIDFVFTTEEFEVARHRILDMQKEGRFPSDHLPVVAHLRIAP